MWFTSIATATVLIAPLVSAHYAFPYLVIDEVETGEWVYMRMTENHYSTNPVCPPSTDVVVPLFKTYVNLITYLN